MEMSAPSASIIGQGDADARRGGGKTREIWRQCWLRMLVGGNGALKIATAASWILEGAAAVR
jgi:hypothetical protein